MKKKLFVLLLLAVVLLTSCRDPGRSPMETNESSIFDRKEPQYGRIISLTTNIRSGLGHDFDSVGSLNQNDIIKILRETEDWYVIQLDNNQIGSVDRQDATPIVREKQPQQQQTPAPDQMEPPAQDEEAAPEQDAVETPAEDAPETPAPPVAEAPEPTPTPAPDPTPAPIQEPVPVEGVEGLSSQEQQMVDLVNGAREENGLPPLRVDLEVTRVARIKSQDMEDNNYFSHYSPVYGSPFEMMDSFGINYIHAGENLAGNSSVEAAHQALMNSSGHRKNILSPDFTHIGVGIRPSNRYGMLFTQMFISKPQ
ncbi:MAG: SCP-like extracellular protein [Clostridiaceae bacterium]|nr:SCP-like extracellular protein [Clostridiaceae bacterium]